MIFEPANETVASFRNFFYRSDPEFSATAKGKDYAAQDGDVILFGFNA